MKKYFIFPDGENDKWQALNRAPYVGAVGTVMMVEEITHPTDGRIAAILNTDDLSQFAKNFTVDDLDVIRAGAIQELPVDWQLPEPPAV